MLLYVVVILQLCDHLMPLGRVLPEGQARVGPLCYCIPSTSQVLGRWPVRDRQESPVPEALAGGRREKAGLEPALLSPPAGSFVCCIFTD